jgi:hypothetical protein
MSHRRAAIDVEHKIIGKGTVLIAAWALTTRVVFKEESGDTPETRVAANTDQDGMPTNGVMLTAGVNGTMGTRTEGGAKERTIPRAKLTTQATSKDLPKEKVREKGAATREGMPQIVNVKDLHLHLVVHLRPLDLHLQVIALGVTQELLMLRPTKPGRAMV